MTPLKKPGALRLLPSLRALPLPARGQAAPWVALMAALVAALMSAPMAGCSQRQIYQSVQGWQQQECWRIADAAERKRCLASTATSWDDYQRQRAAAQGPK
jgi:hypothetical protein